MATVRAGQISQIDHSSHLHAVPVRICRKVAGVLAECDTSESCGALAVTLEILSTNQPYFAAACFAVMSNTTIPTRTCVRVVLLLINPRREVVLNGVKEQLYVYRAGIIMYICGQGCIVPYTKNTARFGHLGRGPVLYNNRGYHGGGAYTILMFL